TLVGSTIASWGLAARVAIGLIVVAVVGPAVWMFIYETRPEDFVENTTIMTTLLACAGLIMLAGRAAASVAGEKERDTWLTLLSTPLDAQEIVWGKMIGSLLSQWGLAALLAFLWLLQSIRMPSLTVAVLFTAGTVGIVALFATSLGTLFSLQARNST